ncbi:MAG: site-2 protease family protein [Thermoplasmata archaeon]
MFHGLTILFLAFTGWLLLLYVLEKRGLLERLGLTLMGPFLMLKTTKGRAFIERLSQWRAWSLVGKAFILLVAVTMVGITLLLLWTATLVQNIPAERAPSPQTLLGLPGVNPFIPLTYGIFALAIAIVVHEFSHGILARRWRVTIKSLGLLLFIVPIGAFVEPEEEELKALDRRKRGTVYAAGPGSNVVLAVIMALLFSFGMMASVQAKAVGMGITVVVEGSPAEVAGLSEGMIITYVDGKRIVDRSDFSAALAEAEAGDSVTISVYASGEMKDVSIVLADRYDFTGLEEDRGRGYVGVSTVSTNPDIFNPQESRKRLGMGNALFVYLLLPFQGLSPVQPPLTDFYEVTGAWGLLPPQIFWIIANAIYWLFWINLMLGMTNALPAVPLDGGYLFRDWLEAAITKIKANMRADDREKVARNISYLIALMILALILWQMIGPRI